MKHLTCIAITIGISTLCNIVMAMPKPQPQNGAIPPGSIPIISYYIPGQAQPYPGAYYGGVGGEEIRGRRRLGEYNSNAVGELFQAFLKLSGFDNFGSRALQGLSGLIPFGGY